MGNEVRHDIQKLYGQILKDMSGGILLMDMEGKIILHDPDAAQFLGVTDNSLEGADIDEIEAGSEDGRSLLKAIREVMRLGEKGSRTVPFLEGEETQYLRVTTDPLREDGVQIGVIVTITDITETTMLFIANKRLANQVMNLMRSFVEVMVTAIEERSAYNANHTKSMVRYASAFLDWLASRGELTQHTAENTAPFLMSIWLHDIGKLLVPPEVLDKPSRLGSALKDVQHRIETEKLMQQIEMLRHPAHAAAAEAQIARIEAAEALILSSNTAGYLDDDTIARLREAASIPCTAADGTTRPLLDDAELTSITVQRGTLTAEERKIIESHVSFTAKLLSKVEFRGAYRPVPRWAAGHHELLDGSGYPDHLKGDAIPWETRLLTIIDIYDALTAEDRPYKPPLPPEKAFTILRGMAKDGKIDAQILEGFYESRAWERPHDGSPRTDGVHVF